jgi:2-polyprenyl-3-methyl-5-hydroxy-6-metoxy-1,4-benzoquinol methylase
MDSTTLEKLIQVNYQFYQTFAAHFAETRQRLQPGVVKLLERIPPQADILDVGCGNGQLGQELARRNHRGRYLGLDFSTELLDVARSGLTESPNISYTQADLTAPDWAEAIDDRDAHFDVVLAFAVFHHIPGHQLHRRILEQIRTLLKPEGRLMHSNWQFLNSPRLRKRIQPWEKVGLKPADIGPDDYLLDWRRGGRGYRYVHHFNEEQLAKLAAETGFRVVETFYSDGKGGNLALYQVWEPKLR